MDFTIQNTLIPVDGGYATTDIQIQAGQFTAIAPNLPVLGTAIAGTNTLALPGFVNAHTHSSELWQRGLIAPLPLELWIAELYDHSELTPELVYWSSVGTAIETLLSGGTTVVDHLVMVPGQELASIAAAAQAYRDVGIRAFIGPLISDMALSQSIPDGGVTRTHSAPIATTAALIDLMTEAIAAHHDPAAGIHLMVAPTGLQLCSETLFKALIELSDRHDLRRHTHLLETKAQQLLAQERFGCTAVEQLHKLGYLSPQTSLAHSIWLTESDIDILAATQATVVHNPTSNLRLGSGLAPVLGYRAAGVNVAFGCDGTASSDGQDLLEVIKLGTLLHNTTDFDYRHWITPREAIAMASHGGAVGLAMGDRLGQLAVGMAADIVLYDLTQPSLLPRTDPVGLLVMGRPQQVVRDVWVQGRPVIRAGRPTAIDFDHYQQHIWKHSQPWRQAPHSPTRHALEPHYRQVMGLNGNIR